VSRRRGADAGAGDSGVCASSTRTKPGRLRADVAIAFADTFSLGALNNALKVRFTPNSIRVLILHSIALAAPVHDAMDGDGSVWHDALPGTHLRLPPSRTRSSRPPRSDPRRALPHRRGRCSPGRSPRGAGVF
jgi:hypothetical protein